MSWVSKINQAVFGKRTPERQVTPVVSNMRKWLNILKSKTKCQSDTGALLHVILISAISLGAVTIATLMALGGVSLIAAAFPLWFVIPISLGDVLIIADAGIFISLLSVYPGFVGLFGLMVARQYISGKPGTDEQDGNTSPDVYNASGKHEQDRDTASLVKTRLRETTDNIKPDVDFIYNKTTSGPAPADARQPETEILGGALISDNYNTLPATTISPC